MAGMTRTSSADARSIELQTYESSTTSVLLKHFLKIACLPSMMLFTAATTILTQALVNKNG